MNKIFSYIGIGILRVFSYIPFPLLYLISDFLFLIIYYVVGYRRKVVAENLLKSFPNKSAEELKEIERKYYRYLCDTILETTKLWTFTEADIHKRVKVKNSEEFYALHKTGKSMALVLGHYLNWEWFVLALPVHIPGKVFGIYKPLTNKLFDQLFIKLRSRLGMDMVPMQNVMRRLLQHKGQQFSIAIVSDQNPSNAETSYWTRFLNQDTAIFLGSEKISKKFDAAIIFLNIERKSRGYLEFEFVVLASDVSEMKEFEITELHTKYLEKIIENKPEYWLWSHRRWKHKPPTKVEATA